LTRQRLRPAWSPAELAVLYGDVHDCRRWRDHQLRVPVTARLAQWMISEYHLEHASDLSCGEGSALDALDLPASGKHYGDIVPGRPVCGPIQETIHRIPAGGLLICGETIEHLDDPDGFLASARPRVSCLVLSTPVGSWDDPAPGHYWAWDRPEVEAMLAGAGFTPAAYLELSWPGDQSLPHTFGIWGCR
jgi:hypothetical protein